MNSWLKRNAELLGAYQSLIGIISLPLIIVGGLLAYNQLKDYLIRADVSLSFSGYRELRFTIDNPSSKIVRDPKYQLLIYDLDIPGTDQPYLNLRIPVKITDYIRPENVLGPWNVTSLSTRGAKVEDGHHLFGYAQIQCPDCVSFRRYWIYHVQGEGGWYAEIPQEEHPLIMKKLANIIHGDKNYSKLISDLVSEEDRIITK